MGRIKCDDAGPDVRARVLATGHSESPSSGACASGWRVEPSWDRVRERLATPTMRDGRYAAIGVEPFTTPTDHPSMLMAYGFLPPDRWHRRRRPWRGHTTGCARHWQWASTWGWDYPVLAMTAARLGRPADAIDALLLDVPKNRWVANGHNPQRRNLPVYLPANGGLLAADRDDGRRVGRRAFAPCAGISRRWHLDGARGELRPLPVSYSRSTSSSAGCRTCTSIGDRVGTRSCGSAHRARRIACTAGSTRASRVPTVSL